ncbi:oligogalacturonide lyase [Granulicella rosea]|uniref:Oligogalacturonide lyase n=1 Tax=Granulicella rosea TaxID=474952 RepID=A0A239IYY2_9BACT|nr:oligogalacturonate lyase family protein [Granulicella rosea]SNS98745.1 oligogalacturonide lyase [Granulicella rosea]
MLSALRIVSLLGVFSLGSSLAVAQATPPRTWVDKDTGHRVYRLSDEPGSSGFYFNVNAYSPDKKLMVYTAPDGIHTLELATKKTRLLVANAPRPATGDRPGFRGGVRTIVVGSKTNSVFFTKFDPETEANTAYKADLITGAVTRLVALPPRASITSVNADETLAAGTYDENEEDVAKEYGGNRPLTTPGAPNNAPPQAGNLVQPEGKGAMMERRLASRIPVVLYTINLKTGSVKELLHSTDWIGHLLFSPTDPQLLMYCHEGPWQKVDRIWMIHTDGTHNTLIHKRTMLMEIAGHEFWGLDGRTIWYDWQYPKGEDFFLAGYNLETHRRTAYHMQRNEWSIHFNLTHDLSLFTGDGGDPGQVAKAPDGEWIELFRPREIRGEGALDDPNFWQPGVFESEHLVNMAHHNYKLEPNVRFTPDKSMVIFTSNMFGASYVIGVDVAKAMDAKPDEVVSTPELASRFNPSKPTPTPNDK